VRNKRSILFAILTPAAGFLIALILMQVSTDGVMREIEDAFYCTDYYVSDALYRPGAPEYSMPGIRYVVYPEGQRGNLYAYFNQMVYSGSLGRPFRRSDIHLTLRRVFAWHNFQKGTLWIEYSCEIYKDDGDLCTGSWHIPVTIQIEKDDGKWTVMDIHEAP
jgi:hypothetical protein